MVHALVAVVVALVDGVHADVARTTVGTRLSALADGHGCGPGVSQGGAAAAVGHGVAQVVEMSVGYPRQALEAPVPEHLVLPPHQRPRRRPWHLPQRRVHFRQQLDVLTPVTPLERHCRRLPTTILHFPRLPLPLPVIPKPHQRPPYEPTCRPPVRQLEVHLPAPLHESPDLFQRLQPFRLHRHDHPPFLPHPPSSGSSLLGFHLLLQAHVSLENSSP